MAKTDKKNSGRVTIIKREEIVEGGHHGGAWKVAYADFVTAMMAFFLLMWLLNATTEEQRKGLADYFSPTNVLSHGSSGSGRPFGGHTPFDQGTMVSDRGAVQIMVGYRPVADEPADDDDPDTVVGGVEVKREVTQDGAASQTAGAPQGAGRDAAGLAESGEAAAADDTAVSSHPPVQTPDPNSAAEQARREQASLEDAARRIKDAVRADPGLAEIARQLAIDITPEGLRIQILDEDHQPMFATGSAAPNERARLLLQKVTPVLLTLKEDISLAGHTDAAPFRGGDRSNWELSAERANGTRRLMVDAGLPQSRIRSVTGNADRDPLLPADPMAAANRRIAIVVLRSMAPPAAASAAAGAAPSAPHALETGGSDRVRKAQPAPSSSP